MVAAIEQPEHLALAFIELVVPERPDEITERALARCEGAALVAEQVEESDGWLVLEQRRGRGRRADLVAGMDDERSALEARCRVAEIRRNHRGAADGPPGNLLSCREMSVEIVEAEDPERDGARGDALRRLPMDGLGRKLP